VLLQMPKSTTAARSAMEINGGDVATALDILTEVTVIVRQGLAVGHPVVQLI